MNDVQKYCISIIRSVIRTCLERVGLLAQWNDTWLETLKAGVQIPAIDTRREKMPKRMNDGQRDCISKVRSVIKDFYVKVGLSSQWKDT
jgi:hypothetical protein